jgi:hypothetical protein
VPLGGSVCGDDVKAPADNNTAAAAAAAGAAGSAVNGKAAGADRPPSSNGQQGGKKLIPLRQVGVAVGPCGSSSSSLRRGSSLGCSCKQQVCCYRRSQAQRWRICVCWHDLAINKAKGLYSCVQSSCKATPACNSCP